MENDKQQPVPLASDDNATASSASAESTHSEPEALRNSVNSLVRIRLEVLERFVFEEEDEENVLSNKVGCTRAAPQLEDEKKIAYSGGSSSKRAAPHDGKSAEEEKEEISSQNTAVSCPQELVELGLLVKSKAAIAFPSTSSSNEAIPTTGVESSHQQPQGDRVISVEQQVGAIAVFPDGRSENLSYDDQSTMSGSSSSSSSSVISISIRRASEQTQQDPNHHHLSTGENSYETTVTATTVDDDMAEIEQEVRDRILREAVEASVVTELSDSLTRNSHSSRRSRAKGRSSSRGPTDNDTGKRRVWAYTFLACLILGLVGAAVVAVVVVVSKGGDFEDALATPSTGKNSTSIVRQSTLEKVRERGVVRCGMYESLPGVSAPGKETEELEGIMVDMVSTVCVVLQDALTSMKQSQFPHDCISLLSYTVPSTLCGCVWKPRSN